MSARRPHVGTGPAGSSVRGVILVALAVLLGALLLRSAFDDDDSGAEGIAAGDEPVTTTVDPSTETSVDGATDTAGGAPTSAPPAVVEARPPNEVRVLVLNGTPVQGAARRFADRYAAANYVTVNPGNLPGAQATSLWFVPGYEADARAAAEVVGISADRVAPLPEPAPVPDLQGAHLVVHVGPELAQS